MARSVSLLQDDDHGTTYMPFEAVWGTMNSYYIFGLKRAQIMKQEQSSYKRGQIMKQEQSSYMALGNGTRYIYGIPTYLRVLSGTVSLSGNSIGSHLLPTAKVPYVSPAFPSHKRTLSIHNY
jgi:hypothetical protein